MVGCHPEEFMTRMQNRELPLYQSEVDFLIFICDQMATARQTTTRRVYRHRFKPVCVCVCACVCVCVCVCVCYMCVCVTHTHVYNAHTHVYNTHTHVYTHTHV